MKLLAITLITLTSINTFAATNNCQKAAESFALKDAGKGAVLFQDTVINMDGSFEIFTAKDEVDSEYKVKTKLSESGSCKVIAHKLVDSQSG